MECCLSLFLSLVFHEQDSSLPCKTVPSHDVDTQERLTTVHQSEPASQPTSQRERAPFIYQPAKSTHSTTQQTPTPNSRLPFPLPYHYSHSIIPPLHHSTIAPLHQPHGGQKPLPISIIRPLPQDQQRLPYPTQLVFVQRDTAVYEDATR